MITLTTNIKTILFSSDSSIIYLGLVYIPHLAEFIPVKSINHFQQSNLYSSYSQDMVLFMHP